MPARRRDEQRSKPALARVWRRRIDEVILDRLLKSTFVGITHLHLDPTPTYDENVKSKARTSNLTLVARGVRPDGRRRIALGRAIQDLGDASFDVYRDADGTIVLDPRVSIPASEVWLFRNPKALRSVRRGLEQAAARKTKSLGSFRDHIGDDES